MPEAGFLQDTRTIPDDQPIPRFDAWSLTLAGGIQGRLARKPSIAGVLGVFSVDRLPPDFKIAGIMSGTPLLALVGQFLVGKLKLADRAVLLRHGRGKAIGVPRFLSIL